jgi:O-antigen/teichoic acid export membrane protein
MTLQRWVARLGGVVTIAVLTRFLAPEDFGVVAAAMTVTPIVTLLADMGFSTYVVQAERVDRKSLSTCFYFSTSVGLLLAAVMVVAAPLFARVFGIPDVTRVLPALAPAVVLVSLQAVPVALLRRRLRFRALAIQGVLSAGLAQVAAIVLAVSGAGVWALVVQQVLAQAVVTVFAWVSARWLPRLTFSRSELVRMIRFGGQVVLVDLVATVRGWVEVAIVSNVLGAAALGYLTIARRLIDVTADVSAAAIPTVTQVVFAKIRETRDKMVRSYLGALRVAYATVSLPLLLVASASGIIVPLAFGPGWDQSVPVAAALAVAGVLTLGAAIDQGLFYGLGRPGRWLGYAVVVDAMTAGTTALAVRFGLVGVAIGFLCVALVATSMRWVLVGRTLDVRATTVAGPFVGMLPVFAVTGGVGLAVTWACRDLPGIVGLLLVGLLMATAHLLMLRWTARPTLGAVVRLLGLDRRLGPLSRPVAAFVATPSDLTRPPLPEEASS